MPGYGRVLLRGDGGGGGAVDRMLGVGMGVGLVEAGADWGRLVGALVVRCGLEGTGAAEEDDGAAAAATTTTTVVPPQRHTRRKLWMHQRHDQRSSKGGSSCNRTTPQPGWWRTAPWAAVQLTAPYLGWAYRAVVITSDAPALTALPLSTPHCLDTRTLHRFAAAIQALASSAYMLHYSGAGNSTVGSGGGGGATTARRLLVAERDDEAEGSSEVPCRVLLMGERFARSKLTVPSGWALARVGLGGEGRGEDNGTPEVAVEALQRAGVVVVDAAWLPLYLAFARRRAVLVWVWSGDAGGGAAAAERQGAALLCELGLFGCVHTHPRGLKQGLAAATRSRSGC